MHYETVDFSGIKNNSGQYCLAPITVVSGPNESGKSALLEALRLAVTGSAQIGGTGKAISEMLSENNAHAIVLAGAKFSKWQCKVGEKVSQTHEGDDSLQGNQPISVEEFDKLSSAQKFALVGKDSLCDVIGKIEEAKAEAKRLRALIDTPPPPMPDPYDGEPLQSMEAKHKELVLALAKHDEASQGLATRKAAREREEQRMKEAAGNKSTTGLLLKDARDKLRKLEDEQGVLHDLVSRYDEAAKQSPPMVEWARRKKYNSKELVENLCIELAAACKWMGAIARRKHQSEAADELEVCMEILSRVKCKHAMPIPEPVFDRDNELWALTKDKGGPHSVLAALGMEVVEARDAVETLERDYDSFARAEHNHAQSLEKELAIYGDPLSPEVLSDMLDSKHELEQAMEKCKQWEGWDALAGKHAVSISQSVTKLGDVDDKLSRLNKERADIVASVTGPIEELANKTLRRAGLPSLSVSVEATAKTAQLVVRTEQGIQIAALAKSRRLAYSICLLSAIQQLSGAQCPLLLAECAEMDGRAFESFAGALSVEKGNIVLEHWVQCRIGHVIKMEKVA